MLVLIEPRYAYEEYFFAATLFLSEKGEVISPNAPRYTATWTPLDDFVLHAEPGMAFNKTFSAGLSVEYRNPSFDDPRDEAVWVIPTLYVYPAPRAQWWLWAGVARPLVDGAAGTVQFSLGSEVIFTF
jgi:hypothetical protein